MVHMCPAAHDLQATVIIITSTMCSTSCRQHHTVALQVLSLESKCKDFQVNISALREEISERETVIAQNYTTIQLLRRRLADMEKHKFVLGYRTQVRAYLQSCAYAQLNSQHTHPRYSL